MSGLSAANVSATSASGFEASTKISESMKPNSEALESRLGSQSGLLETKDVINSIKNEVPIENIEKSIENISANIEKINTLNQSLEGMNHPETGIPYESKVVTNSEGKQIEGVFPDFSEASKFETNLPENLYMESDNKQFEYCNEKMKEAYDSGKIDTTDFSDRQIEQIKNGDKPEGYTWHHSEDLGKMQIVPTNIHGTTGHTGGKSIWGGGRENR
jgi:hypothetical protein